MKNKILKLMMIVLLSSTLSVSCSSEKTSEKTEQVAEISYYCPMKCEGEKTYTKKRSCPQCGMNLVEVE